MRSGRRRWITLASVLATCLATSAVDAQVIETPPPPGTFQLRSNLQGVHPRLHFTAADIPALRAKGQGGGKFFVDRMKESFGGYVGGSVNINASWKGYLYGVWGQLSMAMLNIVEQDPAYADTAKSWALHFARDDSWPGTAAQTDDLIPQEIVTGMALTYDILYDELTPAERKDIRTKLKSIIDTQYDRFFLGQYWTTDFQNNHMHNRISGLGHAAIAILGDDPGMDVQKHADLAYYAYLQVRDWAPPDGSNHEGPGYWGFGYHWVTRIAQLFEHTTGIVPTDTEHDQNSPYYRLYLLTPGMLNTFGIADTGGYGPAINLEAMLPTMSRFQDERLHGFIKDQMDRNADKFYQQLGWGLLWYDPTVGEQDYKTLPLSRVWPDIDAISVRSGWEEDDVGAVFICGPPGGHHMQQLRGTDYVNVAHDHPDQNHFMIWAHGKMLTDDDGYPKSPNTKLTASHNTILIDGEGGPEEGTGWYQPFPYDQTAFMQDVAISGATAYSAGNASRLYTYGERFIRHFLVVEGEYVMIIDDVKGAGAQSREFDWRLHKDGSWNELGGGEFEVTDGDAGLHVRFVGPATSELSTSFFPAQGSAKPGLSAKVAAAETQFLTVLTPQLNASPTIAAQKRDATNGWAIRAEIGGKTDLYAAASGAEPVTVDDVEAEGAGLFVRREGTSIVLALLARGTSLEVGGETVVGSDEDVNLAWRPDSTGGRLEVEPPYKQSGGATNVQVGTLVASSDYCVSIDGVGSGKVTTDGSGTASVQLDVPDKRIVVLEQAGSGASCPTDPIPDGGTGGSGGGTSDDGGVGPDGSSGSGGSSGTGGSSGSGGTGGSSGSSPGVGPSATGEGIEDSEGCACSLPGTRSGPGGMGAVFGIVAGLLGVHLRRRKHNGK